MVKVLAAQCPPDQRRVPAADQAVLLRPAPGGHPGRRAAQLHGQSRLKIQTNVHPKVRNHGEGYYRFHI